MTKGKLEGSIHRRGSAAAGALPIKLLEIASSGYVTDPLPPADLCLRGLACGVQGKDLDLTDPVSGSVIDGTPRTLSVFSTIECSAHPFVSST